LLFVSRVFVFFFFFGFGAGGVGCPFIILCAQACHMALHPYFFKHFTLLQNI